MSGIESSRARSEALAALEQRERRITEQTEQRSGSLLRYLGAAYFTARRRTAAAPKQDQSS